jgi:putative redox protein
MAAIKQKTVVNYTMNGKSVSHARTDSAVRDVALTTDEPVARDGTNLGLSPTETLMAALIGCTNNISLKIAHHHGVEMEITGIDAEVFFDRRGVILEEDIPVPFPEVNLTVNVRTEASDRDIEEIKTDLGKFCPVAKVLRAAGTRINEIWNVTRG